MRNLEIVAGSRWPRVLAFLHGWSPTAAPTGELRAIRSHLRGLGAELVVVSAAGAWRFRPDDHVEKLDDRGLPPAGSTPEWECGSIDDRGLPPAGSIPEWECGSIDDRGLPPAGSTPEWECGSIDDRGLPPAGSTPEWECGSIDDRGLPPAGSTPEWECGSIDDRSLPTTELASRYGVPDGSDAVFVIDHAGAIRFSHYPNEPLEATLVAALDAASEAVLTKLPTVFTRREWLTDCLIAGFALVAFGCKSERRRAPEIVTREPPAEIPVTLDVNRTRHLLRVEPRVSLLDALRERLGLTGTKKGCDAGQCGACTVLVGDRRVVSCLTLAVMAQGQPITTIEGLASGDELHPVQAAFIEHDALQCGYCTPGQVMSAVALLAEDRAHTDDEVREQMSGNICRCGAYPNIVAAIQAARGTRRQP